VDGFTTPTRSANRSGGEPLGMGAADISDTNGTPKVWYVWDDQRRDGVPS